MAHRDFCSLLLLASISPLSLLSLVAPTTAAYSQDLTLLSTDSAGQLSTFNSDQPFVSGDGRFVVFKSSFLFPGDTNAGQVYLREIATGTLELISATPSGATINNEAILPGTFNGAVISDNGRYVAFRSAATDVVAAPATGGFVQLYVRDRETNTTSMISVTADGTTAANGHVSHFAMAPHSGTVPPGVGTTPASLSIAFNSSATNLDPSDVDGLNNTYFYSEAVTPHTRVGCIDKNGALIVGGCTLFAFNGSEIVFVSGSRLVIDSDIDFNQDIFYALPFVGTGTVHLTLADNGVGSNFPETSPPSISNEGGLIAFASSYSLNASDLSDTPGSPDVWIYRLDSGEHLRIGGPGSEFRIPRLSTSGRYLSIQTSESFDPVDLNFQPDIYMMEFDLSITSGVVNADWRLISQNQSEDSSAGATWPNVANQGTVVFASTSDNLSPILDDNFISDVFASGPLLIFTDGFETGDTSQWSSSP